MNLFSILLFKYLSFLLHPAILGPGSCFFLNLWLWPFYCVKYPYLILTNAYVLAGANMNNQMTIGQFMVEVDVCKDSLLTKLVNVMAWLHVVCFYGHTVNNTIFFLYNHGMLSVLCKYLEKI